jgi:hypothetical protein
MNTQEYTSDRIRRIQSAQNTVKYVCIVGIHENTTTIFGGEYTRIWGETPLLPLTSDTVSKQEYICDRCWRVAPILVGNDQRVAQRHALACKHRCCVRAPR